MTNLISQDNLHEQNLKLSSLLSTSQCEYVNDEISGRIFQEKNFAKDWDSIYVHPSDLDYGVSKKGMRKISFPTLVMASHSPKMAFVLASEEEPVFICKQDSITKNIGYTVAFTLKPSVIPEYIFYMTKYESWVNTDESIATMPPKDDNNVTEIKPELIMRGSEEHLLSYCNWSGIGTAIQNDDLTISKLSAEVIFRNICHKYNIPSISAQKQIIVGVKSMEKILLEKMAKKERKFQQKEWLNEAHIRNSKHRLSNDIMPIRMAIERLQNFLKKHPDGIKSSDVIGGATKQSVNDLFESLIYSIEKIETDIDNLTKSDQADVQVLNVALSLNNYLDKIASKYPVPFKIEKLGFEKELNIKISPKAFIELLDNIVGNAVRHGFNKNRNDYLLQVSLEVADNEMCKITIANNGEPMSERARNSFFEQGSAAGPTGHSGLGGYRIYDICDKAGGEAITPYSKEGFPVVICVKFPLVSSH